MVDNGYITRLATSYIRSLYPLPGIGKGILVGCARQGHTADAGVDPRGIHHLEHMGKPSVFLSAKIPDALVIIPKIERAGG